MVWQAGFLVRLLGAAVCFVSMARAQCEPGWLPGDGLPGLDGPVYALTLWDADGPGPAGEVLVAGGSFRVAGNAGAVNIAAWNGHCWSSFGGTSGTVRALAVLSTGELVAGGEFTSVGGSEGIALVSAARIARWDGAQWWAMGIGMTDRVSALAPLPGGEIVAGGVFIRADNKPVNRIARWDGSAWSAVGSGMNLPVESVCRLPNGDIVAGGAFTSPGKSIARWDGVSWKTLGAGFTSPIHAVAAMANGDVIAGGDFFSVGAVAANHVARWNGSAWSPIGEGAGGVAGGVNSIAVTASGGLVTGGSGPVSNWNGSSWTAIAERLDGSVFAVAAMPGGDLIVGGDFTSADPIVAKRVARWNGAAWTALGVGLQNSVSAVAVRPDGEVIVGCSLGFAAPGQNYAFRSRGGGAGGWLPLGDRIDNDVLCLAIMPDGDVIAAGTFESAGGQPMSRIARWDGGAWRALGSGLNDRVRALAVLHDGSLVAGGDFTEAGGHPIPWIARWDGSDWSGLGDSPDALVMSLAVCPNGDLIAGGCFGHAQGEIAKCIARFDGVNWHSMSTDTDFCVSALSALANGDVIAGGSFSRIGGTSANGIARWDGDSWSALGEGVFGQVRAIVPLPTGELAVGGSFSTAGEVSAWNVAMWDGSWSAMSDGILSVPGFTGEVLALARTPGGELFLGGDFQPIFGNFFNMYARWSPTRAPVVAMQPRSRLLTVGGELSFEAAPANGYFGVVHHWQRETATGSGFFADVKNGPGGASPGGGTVSGASGSLPSPTDGTSATLSISGVQHSDLGRYRIVFENGCGQAASAPAKLQGHGADLNADGLVDDADFVLFAAQYDLVLCADPLMPDSCSADFNHDGLVDDGDFTVFIPAYTKMIFK